MKLFAILMITVGTLVAATPAHAAPVEVRLSAPLGSNAYGQLVIGTPVYTQQVYVEPVVIYAPIEHQRHWRRWCGQYGACGQPVRFIEVRESYGRDYDRRYERRRERRHEHHHHHHHHHGHH